MAARKGPRRRSAPSAVRPAADAAPLPRWVEGMIARGKTTEAEYREHEVSRRADRRVALIRRVPPEVEAEGPEAVEAWADEWEGVDGRLALGRSRHTPRDPRAPIYDYAELHRLGRL